MSSAMKKRKNKKGKKEKKPGDGLPEPTQPPNGTHSQLQVDPSYPRSSQSSADPRSLDLAGCTRSLLTENRQLSRRPCSTCTTLPMTPSALRPFCPLPRTTGQNPVNGERARWCPTSVTLRSRGSLASPARRVSRPPCTSVTETTKTKIPLSSESWSTGNRPTCTDASRVRLRAVPGKNGRSGSMTGWSNTLIGRATVTRKTMTSRLGRSDAEERGRTGFDNLAVHVYPVL